MPRQSITWLITDTHLYHDIMIRECGWPSNYMAQIGRNCRYLIAPQDTLIHLGDVIFYQYPMLVRFLTIIPGKKILVRGNHDRKSNNWYMNQGFSFVADQIVLDDILLTHKPVSNFPDGVKLNVHGHWHLADHSKTFPNYSDKTHKLLSIEKEQFKPVKLQQFIASQRQNDVGSPNPTVLRD